jgi:hypothetical protein
MAFGEGGSDSGEKDVLEPMENMRNGRLGRSPRGKHEANLAALEGQAGLTS